MTQSDAYYRALSAYRTAVGAKRECARDSATFAGAAGSEDIKVTRASCTVDEEWVKEIEHGLVYIEKAIKEERQFIYSNGEVIPIEKVKNVSKDSVEHLARHSDLITRVTEGEDLVPDKLYTVERFNDYTVYENRFLYMLLCYLRDFVTLRYQKILDLTNRYDGRMEVQKEVAVHGRTVSISIDMHEERRDDPYLREHNPAKPLIDRMDLILKTVMAFLATPLMESAGKAPMLKPPITKTNVLKMDNNFKAAVKLYEYIIAYEGPGYTVEEQIKEISPFHDDVAEDVAEVELLISFLAYKHGLDLTDMLRAAYERDEAKRRREELKKKTEQMESVRRRLANEGMPAEAYIVHLEKHVRALQNEVDRIDPLIEEIDVLKAHEAELTSQVEELTARIAELEEEARLTAIRHAEEISELEQKHIRECAEMQTRHEAEVAELNERHAAEISELNERHTAELAEMREAHEAQVNELNERYTTDMAALKESHASELDSLKAGHAATVAALNEQRKSEVGALSGELDESKEKITVLTEQNEALTEEKNCLAARLVAVRYGKGDISDAEKQAMTEKESFDELEKQLEAFVSFYKSQWSLTKRKIRKDLLNLKYIKGQSGKE